ncbi:hypothetical protein BBJ29_008460 [Phytophthora kernoviae]|nr:hypothetical protein BBJ29_008460 [Phytophthora kernoviae]
MAFPSGEPWSLDKASQLVVQLSLGKAFPLESSGKGSLGMAFPSGEPWSLDKASQLVVQLSLGKAFPLVAQLSPGKVFPENMFRDTGFPVLASLGTEYQG